MAPKLAYLLALASVALAAPSARQAGKKPGDDVVTSISGAIYTTTNANGPYTTCPCADARARLTGVAPESCEPDPTPANRVPVPNFSARTMAQCHNGKADLTVDCNIYYNTNSVWLSGGPTVVNKNTKPAAMLEPGYYFFAVLKPGGQNSPRDFAADGHTVNTDNLSKLGGDPWTNRRFQIGDGSTLAQPYGKISEYNPDPTGKYCPHNYDPAVREGRGALRLFPYAQTPNPGGEYTLVCDESDLMGRCCGMRVSELMRERLYRC